MLKLIIGNTMIYSFITLFILLVGMCWLTIQRIKLMRKLQTEELIQTLKIKDEWKLC